MERIEIVVRGRGLVFRTLAVLALVLFIAPLLVRPPLFLLSAFGFGLSLCAIAAYLLGPKEGWLIAEVVGDSLRFKSTKDPVSGIGPLYCADFREFHLPSTRTIRLLPKTRSFGGADNYVCVRIEGEAGCEDVFAEYGNIERLEKFFGWLASQFPNIRVDVNGRAPQ